MERMEFKTRAQASKLTGLSYLGAVNSSSKIEKGQKFNVDTFILYLAPANLSGYNVCPMATIDCINACLNGSGRARIFSRIELARIEKTKLFFAERDFFNQWLFAEIEAAKNAAERKGHEFAVRLNGLSDLSPLLFKVDGVNVLEHFSDITFYDYTKVPNRAKLASKYSNYHLTFSSTGYNWEDCIEALKQGINVAQVFYPNLIETYKGYKVINGDVSDLRYKDKKGVIVGLKFKQVKNEVDLLANPFIVNTAL
jgi:hypothetical protein